MQFFFCHFCPPWPENRDSFNSKGPPAWGSNTQSQPTSLCLLTVLPLLEPQWEKMGFLSFFEAPPPYLDHYPWDVGPWQPKMGPKRKMGAKPWVLGCVGAILRSGNQKKGGFAP